MIDAFFMPVMVLFMTALFAIPASAGCPSQAQVKEKLERLTRSKVEVIAVQESALSGICEVAFRQGSRLQMAYTDADARHFFFGKIFEVDSGRNLTDESLAAINRLSTQEMEELPALTAFSIGNDSAQVLYYVTDPQCPYCKTGEEDLKKMAAQGKIHVRFLLLPLDFHKGAKEQSISVICDKKGLEDFEKGYRSENQCEEGRMLVESTVDLLKKKGITGTPTYIFSDGRIHIGLLREANLERWLKPESKVDMRELKAPGSKGELSTPNQ
jgi:thiol:disulfide interchange protein DsbC